MKIKYQFIKDGPSRGDYSVFIFQVEEEQKIIKEIHVQISGTFSRKYSIEELRKIAAASILSFYLKNIPSENLEIKNSNGFIIKINTSWYPGFPKNQVKMENLNSFFQIEKPKPRLGFNLGK